MLLLLQTRGPLQYACKFYIREVPTRIYEITPNRSIKDEWHTSGCQKNADQNVLLQ